MRSGIFRQRAPTARCPNARRTFRSSTSTCVVATGNTPAPGEGPALGGRSATRACELVGIRHASNPAARAIFDATHLLAAEAAGAEVLLTFNSLDFRRLRAADSPHIEESLSPPNLRNVIERRKDLMRAPLI